MIRTSGREMKNVTPIFDEGIMAGSKHKNLNHRRIAA
jgi:hypothetical protein